MNEMRLWRDGKSVLMDDVREAEVRTLASGTIVALDERNIARPVVCAEIVMVNSEDGPVDDRCAAPLLTIDPFSCANGHAQPRSWIDASDEEVEREWFARGGWGVPASFDAEYSGRF